MKINPMSYFPTFTEKRDADVGKKETFLFSDPRVESRRA